MSFNKASTYTESGKIHSDVDLSTTPVNIGTEGKVFRANPGTVLVGGAAAEVVIFRSQDGNTEYFRVTVPIATVVVLPGFECTSDLEILTASAAGDVSYFIPERSGER